MPVSTTNGMFPLIQALPHEVIPPLQTFQQQVEDEILANTGDVSGPASSVNDRIAVFDGTTGKLIKDGGSTIAEIVAGSGGLVTSVFGRTGNIVAATNDYTWAQINKTTSSLADLATRSASDLNSGTLPDGRFPATLPAISGANLTNLNASNLSSGTLPSARIADGSITLAKLADIATASFLGRNTAGSGVPEVLSVATAKTMLGISGTNTGDVTLAGENYLSLAGQVITANPVNLANTNVTGTLTANKGGTGQSSYAVGDLLYASASTALSKLADVATGNALISGGVGVAPSWGKIDLTTHVSNVLPVANGGTGQSTYTNGQLLIGNTTGNTLTKTTLTGTSNQVIVTNGAGSITLSLPQDIHTGASPSFVGLTLSGNANISGFVGHPSYVSQATNWRIDSTGGADFRYLFVDEMHAKSFIADLEQALAGGQIIAKSVAALGANFTAPAAGGTATLTIRDLPSAPNMAAYESGDFVKLKAYSRSAGSLTIAECVGVVTSYTDQAGGLQTWTFTRGSGANAGSMTAGTIIEADATIVDYGVSGNGFYEVNAIDGVYGINSPYAQIVTWTTSPIAANQVLRTRFGNLRGVTGTTDEYGMIAGTYAGTNGQYFRASNSAFELHGINLLMWDGSTNVIKLDRTAPSFAMGSPVPSDYGTGTGIWMGKHSSAYKFRVGVPGGGGLFWDGSTLTAAGWTTNATSFSSGTTYVASGFDIPAGQMAWFGKEVGTRQGMYLRDSSARELAVVTGGGAGPRFAIFDAARWRVAIGDLNTAFGSDGPTNSMGMKVWNSAGTKIVEFSDVQNMISGWAISATTLSSTGVTLTSGASARISVGADKTWMDAQGLTMESLSSESRAQVKWQHIAQNFYPVAMAGADSGSSSFDGIWQLIVRNQAGTRQEVMSFATSATPRLNGRLHVSGKLSIGGASFESTALEVNSTTGAVLFPRMSTTEKNALTPAEGMVVMDNVLHKLQVYDGTGWVSLH